MNSVQRNAFLLNVIVINAILLDVILLTSSSVYVRLNAILYVLVTVFLLKVILLNAFFITCTVDCLSAKSFW
jgi:hypothetical protein